MQKRAVPVHEIGGVGGSSGVVHAAQKIEVGVLWSVELLVEHLFGGTRRQQLHLVVVERVHFQTITRQLAFPPSGHIQSKRKEWSSKRRQSIGHIEQDAR